MTEPTQPLHCLHPIFRSNNQKDGSFYFTANIQHTELFENAYAFPHQTGKQIFLDIIFKIEYLSVGVVMSDSPKQGFFTLKNIFG